MAFHPTMTSALFDTPLPIDSVLADLGAALERGASAVLVAPPGAGKTTRVPLALRDAPWLDGRKILVLEPRRLAARGAAERMAASLGERVGQRVGLRARLASRVGPSSRIEVITEGVFTRMILDDPELAGIGAVLFDEFHERSLDADLGLALALDAQRALREDLRILVMSATLEGGRVAALLGGGAPVIESEGRAFPVETRYVGRDSAKRLEDQVADVVMRTLAVERGSQLVFLPGQGEIRRVAERLEERRPGDDVMIAPLFGAMDARAQDAAIEPAPPGRRKVVLATSIAETSLTIEGVRVVIDAGLARVPRYEPGISMSRLETVRASRASVDQRRGRAGRTEPGVCIRLWDEPQTQSLLPYAEPEIRAADLTGLVLDCAEWGVADPATLAFLDAPPKAAVAAAQAELQALGALDAAGHITDTGRRLRALPLPPRIARMLLAAAETGEAALAADIAALLVERGLGGAERHLGHRLDAFRRDRSRRASDMRRLAEGWARQAEQAAARPGSERNNGGASSGASSIARLLAAAYPDRVAKARGSAGQFLLANGRAAAVESTDALAKAPYAVIAELQGKAAEARILLAQPMSEAEMLAIAGARIRDADEVAFDAGAGAVRRRRVKRLDAIVLAAEARPLEPGSEVAEALAAGVAGLGISRLPWSKAQLQLRDRVAFLRAASGEEWPDLSDAALAATAGDWLAPYLAGKSRAADIDAGDLGNALDALLPYDLKRRLDAEAPTHFMAPTGNRHPIDYEGAGAPRLAIRVQELYGLTDHPAIAAGRLPLTLELLSPAQRPIQVTRDLPGFWKGSWSDVRSDMRGRYPRHLWPEDPASAAPTARAKPRGT